MVCIEKFAATPMDTVQVQVIESPGMMLPFTVHPNRLPTSNGLEAFPQPGRLERTTVLAAEEAPQISNNSQISCWRSTLCFITGYRWWAPACSFSSYSARVVSSSAATNDPGISSVVQNIPPGDDVVLKCVVDVHEGASGTSANARHVRLLAQGNQGFNIEQT